MSVPDTSRIGRILSELDPEDAAFLSGMLEPAWLQRQRKLGRRDAEIRKALDLLDGTENPSARLAAQMALQEREKRLERLTGDHLLVEAVATILRLNGGKGLTARQIGNIGAGRRSPWKLSRVAISAQESA